MKDLIEALTIFAKYTNARQPILCDNLMLHIAEVKEADPTEEERARLEELTFLWSNEDECWISFHFGRT